jgi:hypothetical protein
MAKPEQQGTAQAYSTMEGPYIVAEVLKPGTYKLSNEKGKIFTNA